MLCSAAELQISEDHDGIMELPADAPIGKGYAEWAGIGDPVLEINLTPNRQDCTGVHGIARDLSAVRAHFLLDQLRRLARVKTSRTSLGDALQGALHLGGIDAYSGIAGMLLQCAFGDHAIEQLFFEHGTGRQWGIFLGQTLDNLVVATRQFQSCNHLVIDHGNHMIDGRGGGPRQAGTHHQQCE